MVMARVAWHALSPPDLAKCRLVLHASGDTVEIFVEADFDSLPEERRRFAIVSVPRHQFSEATGAAARRAGQLKK